MRGRTYGCGLVLAIGLNAGVGHAGSGEVWGLKSQGSFAAPPTHLFRFHADGTDFIDVGAVQIGGEDVVLDGLAIAADGTLHAFELLASGSRHVVIDPDTLVATPVGDVLDGRAIRGAVVNGAGVLLAVDTNADAIVTIDPTDGSVVGRPVALTIACAPASVGTATDLVQLPNGMYVLVRFAAGTQSLLRLDLPSGRLTPLHVDTDPDDGVSVFLAGLATVNAAGPDVLLAYEVNNADDIFSYNLSKGFARTELFTNIIPSYNAGRGDLAASVVVFGADLVPQDLNGDGAVDATDLAALLSAWGRCAGCAPDFNCSGAVDSEDLAILLGAWSP